MLNDAFAYKQNSSFSSQVPGLQLAWDSTSLGRLKECPRKYFYFMIQGLQAKGENVHLRFGLMLHSVLEHFDQRLAQGMSFDENLLTSTREALSISYLWQSDDNNKNRFTFVRCIIWYLLQFEHDNLITVVLANGKAAVELSFRMEIDLTAPDGQTYLLCGHMDRLARFGEDVYCLDRKTSKNTLGLDFFSKYSPDNQMSLYSFAGRVVYREPVVGVIVDAAQVAVNFSRYERGFVSRTPDILDEWSKDTKVWIRNAETYAQEQYWPTNDKSCHNYGGCEFRRICSKSPKVRDAFLHTDFERKVWDPLQSREI